MCNRGLVITLVVLAYMSEIFGEKVTICNHCFLLTNNTILRRFEPLIFWDKNARLEEKKSNSARKTPSPNAIFDSHVSAWKTPSPNASFVNHVTARKTSSLNASFVDHVTALKTPISNASFNGHILEQFFHNVSNQNVFRYSEIQKMLTAGNRSFDLRKAMVHLPTIVQKYQDLFRPQGNSSGNVSRLNIFSLMGKANEFLLNTTVKHSLANKYSEDNAGCLVHLYRALRLSRATGDILMKPHANDSAHKSEQLLFTTSATKTTTNSINVINAINARRTTFDKLKFWERDPVFDIRARRTASRKKSIRRARVNKFKYKHSERRRIEKELSEVDSRDVIDTQSVQRPVRVVHIERLQDSRTPRISHIHAQTVHGPKMRQFSSNWPFLDFHSFKNKTRNSFENKTRNSFENKTRNSFENITRNSLENITRNSFENKTRKFLKLRRAMSPLNDVKNTTVFVSNDYVNVDANNTSSNRPLRTKDEKEPSKPTPDKTQLSPYSLLNQITLKKFKGMDANVTIEVLGRTMEYNDIVIIKASLSPTSQQFRSEDKFDESPPEKKIILIVHGLSVMGFNRVPCLTTVSGLMELIKIYFQHLHQFDIYLIPMANPDGVAAAKVRSYWNKNMSPQLACSGVALDRNFDVEWNMMHLAAASSCSQQYPGTDPFSEPETQAVRDLFHKYSHRIVGYFHVHASSYNQDIFKGDGVLYPKGYTDKTSDDDKYIDMKGEIDEMIKNSSFKVYSINVDTLYNWYGKVAGTSVDYAASVYGIPFAMEFVMQLYEDDMLVDATEERETFSILTEVWTKVIHLIFDFMHRNLKSGDRK